jgi:hypothetical protein
MAAGSLGRGGHRSAGLDDAIAQMPRDMPGCAAMRCVAGVGLLLLVGCNQIFGISQTQPWDAGADVIEDMPHVVLSWQLATTGSSGLPQAVSYPPLTGDYAPRIRIAPLDGEFQTVDYQTAPGKEGWILIPRSYFGKTWRLEYTLPRDAGYTLAAGVPHEVQWAPDEKAGHLVVPMIGRADRVMPPSGSGYNITVNSAPASYSGPHVLTTGLWTDGLIPQLANGTTVDYDFVNARPLSGVPGALDPTLGDRAYLVDFVTQNGCMIASGAGQLDSSALTANVHTAVTTTWNPTTVAVAIPPPASDMVPVIRATADPGRGELDTTASSYALGVAASTALAGLLGDPHPQLFGLPTPVMLTLLKCPYDKPPPTMVAQPVDPGAFPYVLHAQVVTTRKALGVSLSSGLETVIQSSSSSDFKLAFPAPLAMSVTLSTSDGNQHVLAGAPALTDGGVLSTTTGALELTFTVEASADLRADYHDVVLHGFSGGGLTTVRVFTVTAPQVKIDGSLLAPGSDYVFEIRTYKGHIRAPHGDFSAVDYPYGGAVVFTHTFRTP